MPLVVVKQLSLDPAPAVQAPAPAPAGESDPASPALADVPVREVERSLREVELRAARVRAC
jgi:hypothetical protein